MPFEELAPCGFGAYGTCCCTCIHHAKTVLSCQKHQGGKGACPPSQQVSYACLMFYAEDKGQSPIIIDWPEHGMCEGYSARNVQERTKVTHG